MEHIARHRRPTSKSLSQNSQSLETNNYKTMTAEYLLEAISREWDQLGRHPNVQIEFSETVEDVRASTDYGGRLPAILVPIPEREPTFRTTDSDD